MNRRIRELAEQTGSTHKQNLGVYQFYTDELEKFAELIVRECADVLKKDMELAHIQLIPLDFKMYANGRLKRTIQEHFGVEE